MSCSCPGDPSDSVAKQFQKLEAEIAEITDTAKRIVKTASDPFTAVIRFLHERPENVSLNGSSVKHVLLDTFGSYDEIPGLVNILSAHLKEVVRQSNVIKLYNVHFSQTNWSGYLIKLKEQIKFEVAREKDRLVLTNIAGLSAVEHGIDLPVEKILVNPPKLEITLRLGILRPVKAIDI